jgi:hypothetical protein
VSLEELLRDLFEKHRDKITFGPLIQRAAWEFQATHALTHDGMLDGYLTVAFGALHFHLRIGPHKSRATSRLLYFAVTYGSRCFMLSARSAFRGPKCA